MKSTTIAPRFWAKVNKDSGHRVAHMENDCWLWTASTTDAGYGHLMTEKIGRKTRLTDSHRVSWELANGPIPNDLFVLHRCDNKICVRPEHLFLGTNRDNSLDCMAKGGNPHNLPRTHCPKGHLLDQANTYVRPSKNPNHAGARVCRTCTREATKKWSDESGYEKTRGEQRRQERAIHRDTATGALPPSR